MRKIYKTISLEPMTSRLPSVVPAYVPGTNTPITFDEESLSGRGYAYTSNWGLIPCNVEIHGSVCNKHDSCNVISFERLSIWYHKFKEYYKLLNDYGHCNTVYASATQYYDNESKRWPDDLRLGNDRQTYVDLDAEIVCMGGKVSSSTRSQTACQTSGITESVDNGFYKWICENVVPTYKLPKDLQDYWQRDTLYYPDVIKWIGWFENRSQYEDITEESGCTDSAVTDCCDCIEYIKRGGAAELARMEAWYGKIQTNIASLNSKVSGCYVPHIISPIELQNSIEDLGEFTIFCEEYKAGVDYRTIPTEDGGTKTIIHFESGNTHSGTTVLKDGVAQKLVSGMGYSYDERFMELVPDDEGWKILPLSSSSSKPTGYTSSKLQYIHLDNYLTDDVGNMIEGIYDVSGKTNHQPKEGEILEPLYQKDVITNVVNIDGHEKMFKGDVIDSMTFYYKFVDGDKDSATEKTVSEKYKVVEAISGSTAVKETKEATYTETDIGEETILVTSIYDDDIYCDVKYHVGNIYVLYETTEDGKKVQKSRMATVTDDGFDGNGVEYNETVQFEKTRVEYYLKAEDKLASPSEVAIPSAHSISYPIYVYKLKQKEDIIESNTYNTPYADNLTKFNITIDRKYDADWDISGDTKSPLIREEYKLGLATLESVKNNIYIDRGINPAFEKHLKLGEVTSLEALENYGNGYFKIMEN